MKKFNILFLMTLLSAGLIITGCGKKGCTDPDASNYDDEAKKDDGTCEYEGDVVFWYSEKTQDSIYSQYGSTTLHFYLDNEEVKGEWGSYIDPTPAAPDCSTSWFDIDFENNPRRTVDLGSSKSKSSKYRVLTSAGDEVFSGNITVNANACNDIELKF